MTGTTVTGQTVKDIHEKYEGNLVLVERHGDYFPTPEQICSGSKRYLRVYTRDYPDCLCNLNEKGIEISKAQGIALAKQGMIPDSILVSPLARGAQTGLWIQRGLVEAGAFAPVTVEPKLAYPEYRSICQTTGKTLVQIMDEIGDSFPTLIIRGDLDLWKDFPNPNHNMFDCEQFSLIWEKIRQGGLQILCTHWENLVALRMRSTCVNWGALTHEDFLSHPSRMYQWTPTKNGGLIFAKDGEGVKFLGEYDPEFRVIPYLPNA